MSNDEHPFVLLLRALEDAGLRHALIGGHAVNVWSEPRFTAGIDLTVAAEPERLAKVVRALEQEGYRLTFHPVDALPSGPDFVRLMGEPAQPPIDLLVAKTAFQVELLARAVPVPGSLAVATPEDLIVLKLISYRSRDQVDLRSLSESPDLDWAYVERWADAWEVGDRLQDLRVRE
ncbi:MAG: hypothetical protein RBU30_09600 [Polyangia bacterium]|jgi:predicted nucleotidyltransferase|nr:hypothetical protein [Polyangia bacterium]